MGQKFYQGKEKEENKKQSKRTWWWDCYLLNCIGTKVLPRKRKRREQKTEQKDLMMRLLLTSTIWASKNNNRTVGCRQIFLQISDHSGIICQRLCWAQVSKCTCIAVSHIFMTPKWNGFPIEPMLQFIALSKTLLLKMFLSTFFWS